jgi:hypothetical protein
VQIEIGKFYRCRDGHKARAAGWASLGAEIVKLETSKGDRLVFAETGLANRPPTQVPSDADVVAEWDEPTGPVRTVTRKEIVVGEYGKVKVAGKHSNGIAVGVRLIVGPTGGNIADMTAEELRAAALVFTQLADALEEK